MKISNIFLYLPFIFALALSTEPALAGLEVRLENELTLQPEALSYKDGYLHADTNDRVLRVPIEPIKLRESLNIVDNAQQDIFQVSIDSTAAGGIRYIDPGLYIESGIAEPEYELMASSSSDSIGISQSSNSSQKQKVTSIGKFLLNVDGYFHRIVEGEVGPLRDKALLPIDESLRLLETDDRYQHLATMWLRQPRSWPQVYFHFDPSVPGLVKIEFEPQVLFRSPSGNPVEVDQESQEIGALPYISFKEDLFERPMIYREDFPMLDKAASLTAALGILKSSCKIKDCSHLLEDSDVYEQLTKDVPTKKVAKPVVNNLGQQRDKLKTEWAKASMFKFEPEDTNVAWAKAYDILRFLEGIEEGQQAKKDWRWDERQEEYQKILEKLEAPEYDRDNLSPEEKNLLSFAYQWRRQWNDFLVLRSRDFVWQDNLVKFEDLEYDEDVLSFLDKTSNDFLVLRNYDFAWQDVLIKLEDSEYDEDNLSPEEKDFLSFIREELSDFLMLRNRDFVFQNLLEKQFIGYPLSDSAIASNSPQLTAASAVVIALRGKENKYAVARERLQKAVHLSSEKPGSRIEVAKMGIFMASLFSQEGQTKQGDEILKNMQTLLVQATKSAFREVDTYLAGCERNPEGCPLQELLKWEAEVYRAGFSRKIPENWESDSVHYKEIYDLDLSWLHGRFSYLIGIQLEDPIKQKDRLRFLSHYVGFVSSDSHKQHLVSLKETMEDALKPNPNKNSLYEEILKWVTPLSIVLAGALYFRRKAQVDRRNKVVSLNRLLRKK